MPKDLAPASRSPDVTTYSALYRRVKETLLDGQRAVEQQKVRTYWETGRLIQTHILRNKARADYGAEVVPRLADDLDLDESVIRRCVEFARKYPALPIHARGHELTWSHYRKLIAVADDKKRIELEHATGRNVWSAEELAERIKAERGEGAGRSAAGSKHSALSSQHLALSSPQMEPGADAGCEMRNALLLPLKGTFYTYQLIRPKVISAGDEGELLVDLGFSMGHLVGPRLLSAFAAGDIVTSVPKEDAYRFVKSGRTAKDLYTYRALVEKVVDGDTLKARIDLGFCMSARQTLRLRGIDCPEIGTRAGEAARAFVQSLVKEADEVTVRSSRDDKYGRYLADVFIPSTLPEREEVFLNNLLLEQGLAKRWEG